MSGCVTTMRPVVASAFHRVTSAYSVATPTPNAWGPTWHALDADLAAALTGGCEADALLALGRWEQHAMSELVGTAGANALTAYQSAQSRGKTS